MCRGTPSIPDEPLADLPDWVTETRRSRYTRNPNLVYRVHQHCYPAIHDESELIRAALRAQLKLAVYGLCPEQLLARNVGNLDF